MKSKLIILALIASFSINAQIKKPNLSPRIKSEHQVGLANITLQYGQPNKQGRVIFGKLIPYEKLWRTGANSSTKITIDREVSLANNKIPKGTYGLYSIPGKKEWTIIIHKNSRLWGAGGYKQENDLIRFKVPVTKLEDTVETFTIYFEGFNANGGNMVIAWENTKISIPVFVDSDANILKEIDEKINNATSKVSPQTYFDAALFYYEKKIQLKKANQWFDKAIELRPNAYWYVYYKAELAYYLKDYKTAKTFAQKSLDAAKKSPSSDFGYIAKNELLLEKIKSKQ